MKSSPLQRGIQYIWEPCDIAPFKEACWAVQTKVNNEPSDEHSCDHLTKGERCDLPASLIVERRLAAVRTITDNELLVGQISTVSRQFIQATRKKVVALCKKHALKRLERTKSS